MDGCGWQILHSLVLPSAGFRNQFGSFDQGQMSCLYGLKLPCFFESIRMHLYCSIQTQTPIRLLQVVIVGLGLTYVNRKRKRIAVEEVHQDYWDLKEGLALDKANTIAEACKVGELIDKTGKCVKITKKTQER